MNETGNGHNERETSAIPYPLGGGGLWYYIGTLAPPAMLLSYASIFAFIAPFFSWPWNDALRAWFALNIGDDYGRVPFAAALGAALLAGVIAFKCRQRPGPLFPRLWVLGLTVLAGGLAAWQLGLRAWDFPAPAADLAAVACAAAACLLVPRLWRLQPDSAWAQRIAPILLIVVLALLLLGQWWITGKSAQSQREGFESTTAAMSENAHALSSCAEAGGDCGDKLYRDSYKRLKHVLGHPHWQQTAELLGKTETLAISSNELLDSLAMAVSRRLQRRLDAGADNWEQGGLAAIRLDEFQNILLEAAGQDRVGAESAARKAYLELLDKIAALLSASKAKLDEAPVVYDTERKDGPWPPNPIFSTESRLVIQYYQALARLHETAGDIAAPLAALREAYAQHPGWRQALAALDRDWGRHWLKQYIAPESASNPDLANILNMPVIAGIPAKKIGLLFNLDGQTADQKKASSNCEWMKSGVEEGTESLQCRAYASENGNPALRVELRLVYASTAEKPIRIVFFFPKPPQSSLEEFISKAQNALPVAKKPLKLFLNTAPNEANKLCPPPEGKWADECANIFQFTDSQDYIRILIYPNKWKRYDD
jgi:hypothetical protein